MRQQRAYCSLALFLWATLNLGSAQVAPISAEDRGDARVIRPNVYTISPVRITGYTSRICETDSTPFVTATNRPVRAGIIALSRDLLARYTPGAPFRYGDIVRVRGAGDEVLGDFVVEDTMNRRHTRRADIWFADLDEAREFGTRLATLEGPYGD